MPMVVVSHPSIRSPVLSPESSGTDSPLEAQPATVNSLTVVVPVFEEVGNLPALLEELKSTFLNLDLECDLILIDDGSTDGSTEVMRQFCRDNHFCKLIVLRRNYGQTAALMAGFDHARGDVVVALDGDGQNDPADLPLLVEKLNEGFDVVSGWRVNREDARFTRRLPSVVANALISMVTGVRLHDYGCTLKAYRRSILQNVRLYGEMHRFIPIYAFWEGGRVREVEVRHRRRVFGKSKYGLGRIVKVVLDLILITFLWRFSNRPLYVFGGFGLASIFGSFLAGFYAIWLKLFEGKSFIETPMPLLVAMFFIVGCMAILMGLLSEMLMRTYYESQGLTSYGIKETINLAEK
jgi:glycosyltransferase involved in cell wall biosynthesis